MADVPAPRRLFETLLGDTTGDARPALTFVDGESRQTWTRAETRDAAKELGRRIADVCPDRDGMVAVLTASQPMQVFHFLATLSSGRVPAVLTPPTPRLERVGYINGLRRVLEQSRPSVVVTDLADNLSEAQTSGVGPAVVALDSLALINEARGAYLPVSPDTAFVQFSSGTTGTKKAVRVSADAAQWQLRSYGHVAEMSDEEVVVGWLPMYHDMGLVTSVLLPLAFGAHSVLIPPLSWLSQPSSYLRVVDEFRGTSSWHPNFAYAFMAARVKSSQTENVDLSSLRRLYNCSEPATFEAQQRFVDRFAANGLSDSVFSGCYAMAESVFAITHGVRSHVEKLDMVGPVGATIAPRLPALSVGRALPEIEIAVRAECRSDLPDGQVGELWVRGPTVTSGYLFEDQTGEAFVDGWYITGDLGYRRDNQFYVCGRWKDLLIVAGHNVFPEDVEAIVGEVDGIKSGRVAAFGRFDERLQTDKVVVVAEVENGIEHADVDSAVMRLDAELGLSGARVELVEPGWLIKSSSGKISRKSCADKWAKRSEQHSET